jgi:hypothetical protein
LRYTFFCILAILLLTGNSSSQTKPQPASQPGVQNDAKGELTPEQIIQKMAAKEEEFYQAWMQYTYTQTANVRVLSVDGKPQKEGLTYVWEVVFNDDGSRELKLVRSAGRLRSVGFTPEDKQAIQDINPFALTADELPLYNLKYEGKEKADELNCYVFSVSPKSTKGGRLYFKGKIWVDDQDLQIVKTVGIPVPQQKDNRFPEFETIRQIIDNKYWFPVWTHADSNLNFSDKTVHIEETITYDEYKRFGSKATIQYETPQGK